MFGSVVWCALMLLPVWSTAAARAGHTRTSTTIADRSTAPDTAEVAVVSGREVWAPFAGRGLLGAQDALLEALAGERGANRVVVCAGDVRLPGVLWRRHWALVRAADVLALPLRDMRVLRTTNHLRTCHAYEREPILLEARVRHVVARLVQPMWRAQPEYDAALLELNTPFESEEPLINTTLASQHLESIQYWMELVYEAFWKRENEYIQKRREHSEFAMIVSVIIPAIIFFAFFLCVTFNTGTPIKMPYSNVKEGVNTPWMKGSHSNVKCYPAYGKV